MQAGAMGLPVIASNINGCNEIIVEGKNGMLIPLKDKYSIEKALIQIIDDKSFYLNLKSNTRSMIIKDLIGQLFVEKY